MASPLLPQRMTWVGVPTTFVRVSDAIGVKWSVSRINYERTLGGALCLADEERSLYRSIWNHDSGCAKCANYRAIRRIDDFAIFVIYITRRLVEVDVTEETGDQPGVVRHFAKSGGSHGKERKKSKPVSS